MGYNTDADTTVVILDAQSEPNETLYHQSNELPSNSAINATSNKNAHIKRRHDMESLTYVTVEHDAYFERQKHRKKRSEHMDNIRKWVTSLLIGIFTGITAFSVHWTIDV
jgi:hypothetical protein